MTELMGKAPCIYFCATDDGIILEVNERLCMELQRHRDELVDSKLEKIFTVATSIFQQTHFFPLLKLHGYAGEIFITLKNASGEELPILVNASREVVDGNGLSHYAGIIVRNRKKFEDELLAARKAAEEALHQNHALQDARQQLEKHMEFLDSRLSLIKKQHEELKQFNHVVTHDLQEPLRKLFLFTSMMKDSLDRPQEKNIKKVLAVAERLRSIVMSLQQYVWLTQAEVNPTEVSFYQLVQKAKEAAREEFPNVDFSLKLDGEVKLTGDNEQLEFLIHELIANAIRFRHEQRPLEIEISMTTVVKNVFRQVSGKYRYAEFYRINFKDNGSGFEAAHKEQAFELFRRFHDHSGRGAGLALCRKIVENHHGQIAMISRKEEGVTVMVDLPIQLETIHLEDHDEVFMS